MCTHTTVSRLEAKFLDLLGNQISSPEDIVKILILFFRFSFINLVNYLYGILQVFSLIQYNFRIILQEYIDILSLVCKN